MHTASALFTRSTSYRKPPDKLNTLSLIRWPCDGKFFIIYIGLICDLLLFTFDVKVYLEDSLTDRVWVDLDECRAFVLNLETAFPPILGDARNLFSILCASSGGQTSTGTPSVSSSPMASACQLLQAALYLSHNGSQQLPSMQSQRPADYSSAKWMTQELTDAIQNAVGLLPTQTSKVSTREIKQQHMICIHVLSFCHSPKVH